MASLRLLVRGDDIGLARSANRAARECCEHGVLRNAGVMVPGLAFDDAARTFAGVSHDRCGFGLHATLSAEWDAPRWGPVLPVSQVRSLVDEQGFFTTAPNVLHDRGFSLEEALAEIEAQLDRALACGFRIEYIDEHMGLGWIHPGLRAGIAALAQRRGLVDAPNVPGLPMAAGDAGSVAETWIAGLEEAARTGGGTFLVVTHPICDDEEMRAYTGTDQPPGRLARERDEDRRALLDPRLLEACRRLDVELIRYPDVARA